MVFIEDREGEFDAPIDKVWKFVQLHFTHRTKIHPHIKNLVTEMPDNNTFIISWDDNIDGQPVRIKRKGTIFYPVGIAYEMMEGPFAGSTYFIYYIPRENDKTNVVVAGEFRSSFVDPDSDENDEKLCSMVLSTFEKVFEEDCEYLKNI